MKKLSFLLIMSISFLGLCGQDFQVPKNVKIETEADCDKYQSDILQCIDWMINTPINDQVKKRKEVNSFFILWLTVTSKVSVVYNTDIVNFTESKPEFMMIFMAGWTKYVIETKDNTNKLMGNIKGIEAVIDFYNKNKEEIGKDKTVENLIKLKKDDKLEDYIKKYLK